MLEVQDLVVGYGEEEVLHGVSIQVSQGECLAILGPNGAGKTTLLKTVMGVLRPRRGKILFRDQEITGRPPSEILKSGVSYVPQGGSVLAQMTVKENLELGAYTVTDKSRTAERMRRVFQTFPILEERREAKAGTLSGGERQMLAIGRALMLEPTVMMLDEPSVGLAPKLILFIFDKIKAMHDSGTTVVLVEQNVRRALEISDRAYVLEAGSIKMHGTPAELVKDEAVRDYYLGKLLR